MEPFWNHWPLTASSEVQSGEEISELDLQTELQITRTHVHPSPNVEEMVDFLVGEKELTRKEAYRLASVAVDLPERHTPS